MNKKSEIELTTNALFVIFLVIFAAFVTFSVVKSRTQILGQREQFSEYDKVDSFFTSLLTSKCIVSDFERGRNYQTEMSGFFSSEKLNFRNNENAELDCIDNFYFIYSLVVQDIFNHKTWYLGLKEEPSWAQDSTIIQKSLPVAINYDYNTIYPGRAMLVAYIGEESYLYSMIKLACLTKQEERISVELKNSIGYDNAKNELCINSECFFPHFGCRVDDFNMAEGKQIIIARYKDNMLSVKT
ncbi:hypothetical protein JXA85_02755 [Candidatus Woesearchaeota archaeon]|nr:hypothetical protein [Candidatus Woesearchaeota archaeon]